MLYYTRGQVCENGKHIGKKEAGWYYSVIAYGGGVEKVTADDGLEVLCCTKDTHWSNTDHPSPYYR